MIIGHVEDITLVVQDWGGLIGLPYAANQPSKISNEIIIKKVIVTIPPSESGLSQVSATTTRSAPTS